MTRDLPVVPDWVRGARALAVTGTSSPAYADKADRLVRYVLEQTEPETLITGGAAVVDTYAIAYGSGRKVLVVPRSPGYFNEATRDYADEVVYARPGRTVTDAMMNRNQAMVDLRPDAFVAFPEGRRPVLRSGTWATVRRARKAGIRVWVVPLWEGEPFEIP